MPEAISITLQAPPGEDLLFYYCRALLAFESTTGMSFTKDDLNHFFSVFWKKAKDRFPADADFDEYRLYFLTTFPKVRAPLGSNPLDAAVKRAATFQPPAAERYTSLKLKQLVAICYHLQVLSEDSPFFLSVRSVMEFLGLKSTHQASNLLNGLVIDGILEYTEKGTPGGKRAARFRYVDRTQDRGQT